MILFEGLKVNTEFLQSALNDNSITMGFELEFYVVGLSDIIRQQIFDGATKLKNDNYSKPLNKTTYSDIIKHFYPLKVNSDEMQLTNDEIIRLRIKNLFGKQKENDGSKTVDKMFAFLLTKYKMYHLITLLKVFPKMLFDLPKAQNKNIEEIIKKGNLSAATLKMKDLDNVNYHFMFTDSEISFPHNNEYVSYAYYIIGTALHEKLGLDVNIITNEEPTRVTYDRWSLEFDGSLEDTELENAGWLGVELISPVFEVNDGLKMLEKIVHALNNFHEIIPNTRIETNINTGFHLNLGVYGKELDYMKLLFLYQHEGTLKKFARTNISYAENLYNEFRNNMKDEKTFKDVIYKKLMNNANYRISRDDMAELSVYIKSSIPVEKNMTINLAKLFSHNYVEFRSIGNDDYHKNLDKLRHAINYMVAIFFVATEPSAMRKEYLKMLFRVFNWMIKKVEKDYNISAKRRSQKRINLLTKKGQAA